MANNITTAEKYVSLLDEVYKASARTSILDCDTALLREGANAGEIAIPTYLMDGLGDYDRDEGYADGTVTLTWETVQFNYERGRMFMIDTMDDEETAGVAFGKLAGEFIRTKVVPEVDAFRFASYASVQGVTSVHADLTTGAAVLEALQAAYSALDEAEVPEEGRYLFITPELYNLAKNVATTVNTSILDAFAAVVRVPQGRFYTAIELYDGKTEGETSGGYAAATGALDINFMVIQKDAVIQLTKHAVPKIVSPEANPDADAWKFGYRNYGMANVYANKKSGIYCHTEASS